MIVAIHQPNFFPWLGFFRKIALADVFVFLDCVQYPRTSHGNWLNRVALLINGKSTWVTCPVNRTQGTRTIRNISMSSKAAWSSKFRRTIKQHYGNHPYSRTMLPFVSELIDNTTESLAAFNIEAIVSLAQLLKLECRFIRQSNLSSSAAFEQRGSHRLAAICTELGATHYLAGDGSQEYEQPEAYAQRGITLEYSGFRSPPYPQKGSFDFVSGLSVLDALFNCGPDPSRFLDL